MKENKNDLFAYTVVLILVNALFFGILLNEVRQSKKQSKEHHEKYHELLKENYRLNEWYQNWSNETDCDTFRQPTSVSVECEKYEI